MVRARSWISAITFFFACAEEESPKLTLYEAPLISALSVDADAIYFAVEGRTLRLPKEGGDPFELLSVESEDQYAKESASDGQRLYLLERGGAVDSVPVHGGQRGVIFADTRPKSNLRLDATEVYWSDDQLTALAIWGIRSAPKEGQGARWVHLTQGDDAIDAIVLGADDVYFITRESMRLYAVKKDGSEAPRTLKSFDVRPTALAVFGEYLFVAHEAGPIDRIALDGSERSLQLGEGTFNGVLHADARALYLGYETSAAGPGRVERIPYEGERTTIAEASDPRAIISDGAWIYYLDAGESGHAIRRSAMPAD